ncbi:MAG: Tetraacyldisaccharide 4-kinase [Gemmatimonadetes bacterium]|nr:Tetraacyldisaccharide 4-kinase [Gemmatimonadota bacterium]
MTSLERIWYDDGVAARLGRAALAPPALLYAAVVHVRGSLYDRGLLRAHPPALPVLSLGNLTVGGTGKTPLAAWTAARLREAGARPAVLLRGYGGDEALVHATLNPSVPVIVNADRVTGVDEARTAGADCVILDDGFQHRRLARTADWVLVAAEQFARARRLLPAGPMREPLSALSRAHVMVVTRKSASLDTADAVANALKSIAPRAAVAVCHLAPAGLVDAIAGSMVPLARLRGLRVVAVAAIGAPDAFFAQLRSLGVAELRTVARRDHHRFTRTDVEQIVRDARRTDGVVCTLKDAVKLAPLWSDVGVPLWYVSQRAEIERGRQLLEASLATILSARASDSSTAGAAG